MQFICDKVEENAELNCRLDSLRFTTTSLAKPEFSVGDCEMARRGLLKELLTAHTVGANDLAKASGLAAGSAAAQQLAGIKPVTAAEPKLSVLALQVSIWVGLGWVTWDVLRCVG